MNKHEKALTRFVVFGGAASLVTFAVSFLHNPAGAALVPADLLGFVLGFAALLKTYLDKEEAIAETNIATSIVDTPVVK